MKKVTSVLMFAAAAAATLVSCNKEMDKPEAPQGEGIKVTVIAGNPETKTTLGANGKTVSWNSTDKFGFVNVATPEDNEASITSIDASGAATITGTVANAGTFFAYYPKSTYPATAEGGVLRIQTAQSPASGTTFDPAADVLVSETFGVAASGSATAPATVRFKRLGAFLKVYFVDATTGNKLSGQYATTVSVQSSVKSLAAKLTVNSTGIVSAVDAQKTITATYAADVFELTNASQAAYLGVQPLTLSKDSKLIIKAETGKYTISKTVTLPSDVTLGSGDLLPIRISLADENLTTKVKLNKVVGIYGKAGVAGWPAYVPGGSLASFLDDNQQLRNATFDKDYIYVAQSESWADNDGNQPYIYMFKTSDGTLAGHVTPATDPAYMGGSYCGVHPVSCVRFMDNSKPSVNGGSPVLVAVNLGDGGTHRVYAWENGINAQPRLVANFYNARRLGDKVSVEGNYQDGKLWFRSNDKDGMVCAVIFQEGWGAQYPNNDDKSWKGADVWNWVEARGKMPVKDANNISEYYTFGTGNYGLIATNSAKGLHLMNGTTEVEKYVKYARSFGWHAFTFNGMDYLAFLDASDGLNKPRITVLEGKTDSVEHLQETIENEKIAARVSIASADPYDFGVTTTYAHQNLGDCQVRVLDDGVYILGMIRGGVALFKVELP